MNHIEVLMEHK